MKGQMKVKKLNDTGLYISEMDWDNTYICKENPIGNFVMVIEPLSGFDGFKLNDGEINCQSKEQAEVLSEFFEDLGFDAMPMQQNPDDTWQLYEEWKLM